ncbi:Lumazine-binding protein [Rhizopogon salebrosus TDB-379]|nr:Lumazine-binding protein [Rhizopogon salebrosus TDB-379]
MFTGLIEHLGTVSVIHCDDGGCTLTISQSAPILVDCHVGDSIAVNGACLTVVEFDIERDGGYFKVWLANETLSRTDLGDCEVGDQVNLERAMGAHVRFGGHFVQAHVDTTATILMRASDGDSLRFLFQLPEPTPERPSLLPYIIPKGYIAIDGTSLTITSVDDAKRTFGVMLIQHTQQKVTLGRKSDGERVNIEVDMVGKYVEKSVLAALEGGGGEVLRSHIQRVVKDTLLNDGNFSLSATTDACV